MEIICLRMVVVCRNNHTGRMQLALRQKWTDANWGPSWAFQMWAARFRLILGVLARFFDRWLLANLHLEGPGPLTRFLRSGHFLVPRDLPQNGPTWRGGGEGRGGSVRGVWEGCEESVGGM